MRQFGGDITNAQNVYDILTENRTKCSVCGHDEYTVDVDRNFIPKILGKIVQKDQGITVIVAICKKCGVLTMFDSERLED